MKVHQKKITYETRYRTETLNERASPGDDDGGVLAIFVLSQSNKHERYLSYDIIQEFRDPRTYGDILTECDCI